MKIENKVVENKDNILSEEDKKSMEFLKSQEKEVVVIDVPDLAKGVEAVETKKKKKVGFLKQFLLPRVYITAFVVYILSRIISSIAFVVSVLIYAYCNNIDMDNAYDVLPSNNSNQASLEESANKYSGAKMIYYIACLVLICPIIEELIFRLAIFRGISMIGELFGKNSKFIRRSFKLLAYIISSTLFAIGHFDFNLEIVMKEIVFFPIYLIMGIGLAIAYDYDGYFLAPILTHILNNIIATIGLFL